MSESPPPRGWLARVFGNEHDERALAAARALDELDMRARTAEAELERTRLELAQELARANERQRVDEAERVKLHAALQAVRQELQTLRETELRARREADHERGVHSELEQRLAQRERDATAQGKAFDLLRAQSQRHAEGERRLRLSLDEAGVRTKELAERLAAAETARDVEAARARDAKREQHAERDALRTERDALRAERDELRAERERGEAARRELERRAAAFERALTNAFGSRLADVRQLLDE